MPISRLILILSLSALLCPFQVQADTPRIGLVLSGGGARGSAHIGVLKVLREMRIPVHAIAGTSMGALVGGAYASGLSADEMERRVTRVDWDDLFQDDPPRPVTSVRRKQQEERPTWNFGIGYRDGEFRLPKGAIAGQKVQLFFADLVSNSEQFERFDQLPIPFRAIATDLESGAMEVFDRGSLSQALRASMSVPGLFAPIEINHRLYVDGGLVRNVRRAHGTGIRTPGVELRTHFVRPDHALAYGYGGGTSVFRTDFPVYDSPRRWLRGSVQIDQT